MKPLQVIFYLLICAILLYIAHFVWEEKQINKRDKLYESLTTNNYGINELRQHQELEEYNRNEENLGDKKKENENDNNDGIDSATKPNTQIAQEIAFAGDMFLLNSIIKQKIYCKQWIEIGTDSGVETLWLRMNLEPHKILISYDPIDERRMITRNFTNKIVGDIEYLHNMEDLLEQIESRTSMQILIVHDSSKITPEEIAMAVQLLPDKSLIITRRDTFEDISLGYQEYWQDINNSTFWMDVAESIGSNFLVLEKRVAFEWDGSFPWELFPAEGERSAIAMMEPVTFNPKTDWLIFMRIQKCGTKSLSDIITKQIQPYGCSGNFFVSPPAENVDCHLFDLCYQGVPALKVSHEAHCHQFLEHHCDWKDIFDVWDESSPNTHIVALLRDPIGRTISEYKHVYETHQKTWDYCPSEEQIGAAFSRDNFIAFVNNPQNQVGMWNRQTRMIAGCGSILRCSDIYNSDEEMLEAAKMHLLSSSVVGVLDRFNDMLLQLRHIYGWDINSYTINQEPRDLMQLDWDVDNEVRETVLAKNALDNELYEFASALVEYRTSELRSKLPEGEVLPNFICDGTQCNIYVYD